MRGNKLIQGPVYFMATYFAVESTSHSQQGI